MITLVHVEDSLSGRTRGDLLGFLSQPAPRLPRHDRFAIQGAFGSASLVVHLIAAATLVTLATIPRAPTPTAAIRDAIGPVPLRFVFLPKSDSEHGSAGGGGGGNRQPGPIPRAQAKGPDALTVPVARSIAASSRPIDAAPPVQAVAVDAMPLASGLTFQVGLPDAGPASGSSQGPGSGGGVGTGTGTGIGSGRGPGIGPGSGGGIGGGIYRPGGGVTGPTIIREVRPTYTPEAMRAKTQGLVLLDVVVQRDGIPGDIRIVRSLDPDLDLQAIAAIRAWRFNPGRLNGVAVDVLVTIELNFRIY
jgi:TonB family protein